MRWTIRNELHVLWSVIWETCEKDTSARAVSGKLKLDVQDTLEAVPVDKVLSAMS